MRTFTSQSPFTVRQLSGIPEDIEASTTASQALRSVPALNEALNAKNITDTQIDNLVEISNAKRMALSVLNNETSADTVVESILYFLHVLSPSMEDTSVKSKGLKTMSSTKSLLIAVGGGLALGGLVVFVMRMSQKSKLGGM